MSKAFTLFVLALLLSASINQAARLGPVDPTKSSSHEVVGEIAVEKADEGCEGVGEEECLIRRTLVAHTDYIYTQGGGTKP